MVLGVVAFVVALLVSVLLHEAGHLLTAKKFGMKATHYFAGFGPTLWSFKRGETEYGIKAIPAGGFVKIVGMTPMEEIEPADRERAFYKQPAPQRAVVLAAGSLTHFVIAFLLFWVVLSVIGLPDFSNKVGSIAPCVRIDEPKTCTPADPPAPATLAGLRPGDRVLAVDAAKVGTASGDLSAAIRAHGPGQAALLVERDGQRLTLPANLVAADRPDPKNPGKTISVAVLGVTPAQENRRLGPVQGLGKTLSGIGSGTVLTFKALGSIPAGVGKLLSSAPRDGSGLVGPVGAARVGGEAVAGGSIAGFLLIVAGLNLSVGIFNLLPLFPLDGGHLGVLVFEQIRSGIARVLGRRDPGRVDIARLMPIATVVVAAFVGLSLLLLYADIVNPIANPFQ
ncbi:MAG: RIP metalloprotease [Actinomycetota bacterium]|nr:RIP metalloprotease [Actinomycetota bacterium]